MVSALKYLIFVLFALCFAPPATSNSLSFGYNEALSNEWLEIDSYELEYRLPLKSEKNQFGRGLSWGGSFRLGQLNLRQHSFNRLGAGVFIGYNFTSRLSASIPLGVVWLSEHQFMGKDYYRHYGGEMQFTYGLELSFALTEQWQINYRLEHMSNAYIYDENPGLDTQGVSIRYSF